MFSSQSKIYIGGMLERELSVTNATKLKQNVLNSFEGKLVGFYFNELKVFDMAAAGNAKYF